VRTNLFVWTVAHVAAVAMMASAVPAAAIAQQQPQQQESSENQAQIDLGKQTFAHNCSHCHGPNMINSGTITPDLRRFPDDRPRFIATVKGGKNGRMPPWGDILSDDEIAALWAYVSSRRTP
jgi:mono/diheme cytochrome c family protein